MIVSAYLSRALSRRRRGLLPADRPADRCRRGGATVKAAFAEILEMMVSAFSSQLGPHRKAHEKALGIAALCVGGMVPARAVGNSATADNLREAARKLAVTIGALGRATCRTGMTPWATVVGRPHRLIP